MPELFSELIPLENASPLTPDMWEERIVPVLFELDKRSGVFKDWFDWDKRRVLCVSMDADLRRKMELRCARALPGEPQATICVYNHIEDLSILRRLKDYPDETSSAELLAPWTGWCKDLNAVIAINVRL